MNRPLPPSDAVATSEPALFLAETVEELNEGANFLARLSPKDWEVLRREGTEISIEVGGSVFFQGDEHKGIWLIEEGRVRTFYAAPSGRQITLAYWTAGHFVGGPEIFGGGEHIWSADVTQDCRLLYLPSGVLRKLIETQPSFALCLIEGLVAKGKCYSALAQMLGTRSITERLAHLLLHLVDLYGVKDTDGILIGAAFTHADLAHMVGATRQWVTISLKRLHDKNVVVARKSRIVVRRPDILEQMRGQGE
jgi:CRP/FNR family cyclic AMP-dependent transcriptional regulator